ncbi:DUF3275 family protein [Niveibacterium sp. 24ML]|uniref:DUF3275 family protein n=1 Tax=Niveibacterium sp. 24ML TaxID=2985512 RepID=UPI00227074EB|nr:DUF3275 family protein [Niveibacterium sp. 24ML]MCX9158124.1 DUF3275 family protein [Niveibacterium sp. 24ML]
MPVRIQGTLTVKRINGANGPFCVGSLVSEIGEFRVKDAVLEQFEEGAYQGTFWIAQIFPSSYITNGRMVVEIRAKLADLQIDEHDAKAQATPEQEPDPVNEATQATPVGAQAASRRPLPGKPKPATAPHQNPATPAVESRVDSHPADSRAPQASQSAATANAPASTEAPVIEQARDLALFGESLFAELNAGLPIKLDPTIDRLKFREQIMRLRALGYAPNAKTQTWERQAT